MINIMRNFLILGLVIFGFVSCDDKNNKKEIDNAANQIQTDSEILDLSSVKNSINLIDPSSFDSNQIPTVTDDSLISADVVDINNLILEEQFVPEQSVQKYVQSDKIAIPAVVTANKKTSNAQRASRLHTLSFGSYIKIGVDKPRITVSKNNSQKITIVVIGNHTIQLADVYIYAVPVNSRLVRNNNTLIGYVNNLEMVNNQSQFTRFWRGRRANGTFMKKGRYNIYVEYRYKNAQGTVVKKQGRFWGGSKRHWIVEII
ncbi:MAG: hypothetical protein ACRCTJ_02575 [Brevinema sp.]